MSEKRVGVLAMQGAFSKHVEMLEAIGVNAREVRYKEELQECHGLIIPGGESTAISKLINKANLLEPLLEFAKEKPIFGTCAGLILISKEILHDPLKPLGLIDISIERNAFGRQIDSFHTDVELLFKEKKDRLFNAFFIRAPKIKKVGPQVKVLAYYQNEPILVQQGNILGATFHPELVEDSSIHEYFIKML